MRRLNWPKNELKTRKIIRWKKVNQTKLKKHDKRITKAGGILLKITSKNKKQKKEEGKPPKKLRMSGKLKSNKHRNEMLIEKCNNFVEWRRN